MSNLYIGNKTVKIDSVFQLLGMHENDMSYSLAWGLAQCPRFLEEFLIAINQRNTELSEIEIHLQKSGGKKEGITDIEIVAPKSAVIIEAKRGWSRPSKSQLDKYAKRLRKSGVPNKKLIVLSEYSKINTGDWLKKQIRGILVQPISWREATRCARQALPESSNAQKHLIRELIVYFHKIMTKQKYDSNEVFVVSKDVHEKVKNWKLPPVDMVTKEKRYFHPIGKSGFPKDPPNYIAFRYHGKLQSIHHIDDYTVTRNLEKWLCENPTMDHFLYILGPAIKPTKETRTGKIYRNGKVWCMLDTLLTSKTIAEARDISKKRKQEAEEI